MGEQNFWIEDNDFYTEIVSKIADLSSNTYLLITDLQNDITYVPKTTADFLGIEEDWYHDFYHKAVAYVHPHDRPEYMQEIELRLKGKNFQICCLFVWEKMSIMICLAFLWTSWRKMDAVIL